MNFETRINLRFFACPQTCPLVALSLPLVPPVVFFVYLPGRHLIF